MVRPMALFAYYDRTYKNAFNASNGNYRGGVRAQLVQNVSLIIKYFELLRVGRLRHCYSPIRRQFKKAFRLLPNRVFMSSAQKKDAGPRPFP